jgi:hypothetical protein
MYLVILASGGDLASTGISHGNRTIRIFGISRNQRHLSQKSPGNDCTGDCSTSYVGIKDRTISFFFVKPESSVLS